MLMGLRRVAQRAGCPRAGIWQVLFETFRNGAQTVTVFNLPDSETSHLHLSKRVDGKDCHPHTVFQLQPLRILSIVATRTRSLFGMAESTRDTISLWDEFSTCLPLPGWILSLTTGICKWVHSNVEDVVAPRFTTVSANTDDEDICDEDIDDAF